MAKTSDGLKIINNIIGDDSELKQMCEQATLNAYVAQLIYNARNSAQLSQNELAQRIGTTQSVISRLENGDYEGHSLSMLNRIAQATGCEVKIDLVPVTPPSTPFEISRASY